MTLLSAKKIHFIGVSGIGTSAIAKWALENHKQVSGSDLTLQPTSKWLIENGANISIGEHKEVNLPSDSDLVIYSNAIPETNPELLQAKKLKIPAVSYPQSIGELMVGKKGIAIAGTHGKSTTTAILAQILIEAKKDPTVIVGTRLGIFGNTNERVGKGEDLLVEADEYKRAFLDYRPTVAAILNIELDHVDVYKDEASILEAFKKFAGKLPISGSLILNAQDKNFSDIKKSTQAEVLSFGFENTDIMAFEVNTGKEGVNFKVKGLYNGTIETKIFGQHNVLNILAALAIAYVMKIDFQIAKAAVEKFPGSWRRFEKKGEWQDATVIDDYAHHPTELKATLLAARQAYPGKRVVCVFQPHQKIRTKQFFKEFVETLKLADLNIIPEIYQVAGREENIKISSKEIVEKLGNGVYYAKDVADSVEIAKKIIKPGDVILTVGAGDITNFYQLAKK